MALFKQLLQYVADTFPEITSLLYIINNKCNDTITDLDVHTFKGKDHIFEEMEGLRFKVGPKSFYQTNSEQAYTLYKVARNFAGLTGNELVYDLYTGTGTIANFVSGQARQVIGIEYVPEAIEDAKVNSEINGIRNTLFFAGDMKDMLTQDFINEYGRPDVIITEPPSCGYAPGCGGCYPVCRAETHCVRKLQSRHAGKGLTTARCQIPGEGRPAGGYVPAYASCGKRGAA